MENGTSGIIGLLVVAATFIASRMAEQRGRNSWNWGALTFVTMGMALVLLYFIPLETPVEKAKREMAERAAARRSYQRAQQYKKEMRGKKKCSDCSGIVPDTAKVCMHCGYRFDLRMPAYKAVEAEAERLRNRRR